MFSKIDVFGENQHSVYRFLQGNFLLFLIFIVVKTALADPASLNPNFFVNLIRLSEILAKINVYRPIL